MANTPFLVVAQKDSAKSEIVEMTPKSLLHHSLIVGQSGSGKSFLIARLVEELLLRTEARIIIVDPNGDFRRLTIPSAEVWKDDDCAEALAKAQAATVGTESFDDADRFKTDWAKLKCERVKAANKDTPSWDDSGVPRLSIEWREVEHIALQLLASDGLFPQIKLGIDACRKELLQRISASASDDAGLPGLIQVAEAFADRNVDLSKYGYVKNLTPEDWVRVRAQLEIVREKHEAIWHRKDGKNQRSPCLLVESAFKKSVWQCLTLALEHADRDDALLAAAACLDQVNQSATTAWAEVLDDAKSDDRVPTFMVIDEAHNFAPENARPGLQQTVSDSILRIASEGRKYGLYLVLATQRPSKLNGGLVRECENSAVLRIQAPIEQRFATETLGIDENMVGKVQRFSTGQVLLHGRWTSGDSMDCRALPARSTVGGGGLSEVWMTKASAAKADPETTEHSDDD